MSNENFAIHHDDTVLAIEVPHQFPVCAYSFPDARAFEEWLNEHFASKGEFTDWLCDQHEIVDVADDTTLQALESDPENWRAYWAHDFHTTYVFESRDEAQAMLDQLQPTSVPQRVHGAIGIASAIREWLKSDEEEEEEEA